MAHDILHMTHHKCYVTPDMRLLICDTGHIGYSEYYVKILGLQFVKGYKVTCDT